MKQIADSLRAEASNLLSEVKTLTTKNQDLQEQLSKATAAASSSSFQKRPSESYNSPMPTRIETPTKSTLPETPETLDKKLDVYYDSIDKLALAARGDQPTAVLISMKSVLLACKAITQECEALEQAGVLNDSDRTRLKSGKESLSNCLGHLMALAKDHASGTMSSGSLNTAIDRLTQSLNDLTYIMKRYENGNSDPRTRVNSWATPPESPKAQMSTRSMMNIVELKV